MGHRPREPAAERMSTFQSLSTRLTLPTLALTRRSAPVVFPLGGRVLSCPRLLTLGRTHPVLLFSESGRKPGRSC